MEAFDGGIRWNIRSELSLVDPSSICQSSSSDLLIDGDQLSCAAVPSEVFEPLRTDEPQPDSKRVQLGRRQYRQVRCAKRKAAVVRRTRDEHPLNRLCIDMRTHRPTIVCAQLSIGCVPSPSKSPRRGCQTQYRHASAHARDMLSAMPM